MVPFIIYKMTNYKYLCLWHQLVGCIPPITILLKCGTKCDSYNSLCDSYNSLYYKSRNDKVGNIEDFKVHLDEINRRDEITKFDDISELFHNMTKILSRCHNRLLSDTIYIYKISFVEKSVELLGRFFDMFEEYIILLENKNQSLKSENETLKTMLHYQPGREGAAECQKHFCELVRANEMSICEANTQCKCSELEHFESLIKKN